MNAHSNCPELDPEVTEMALAVMQALLEIHGYNSTHKGGNTLEKSVEALVAAGALSPKTGARLANYQTRFHGFPGRIGHDISVFDVVLATKTPPVRLVGFADGHTQLLGADAQT